ncbi:hypothetical protein E1B28_012643 [Marasmius oreades]|uniref:Carboxylic ester hydrolase n=1 Tax=Marasmius oreades TaxID=181124 RepID=A0A9P7RSY8_9AGAR|nr:uncharacterized protein E1B28_012643 [Marasmius oreades]KAG7088671.1 hypothetical protein E1B28_012643 [Marasmius oreades]
MFSIFCKLMMFIFPLLVAVQASIALATSPTVSLDSATATGVTEGLVSSFYGIPYAQPPTGDRRFRAPVPIPPYTGSIDATSIKPACPQQKSDTFKREGNTEEVNTFLAENFEPVNAPEAEDCLHINVLKPIDATPESKLPVLVWFFGGGFQTGSAISRLTPGNVIVKRSLELNQPVIHVSMDYRSNGFGFMASKEVKAAGVGNIGLRDQREALRWVQKYIGAFGGDPTKVTIWGQSSGAISVALQMVTNSGNTEGLFRAAFMHSGATVPVGDITNGQNYYDQIVSDTGCSGSADTLACLRRVSYQSLMDAINKTPGISSYQSLRLTWLPRVDGDFLTDIPSNLVQQGKIANIPFVSGNCDDEGTFFSGSSLNVTDDAQFREYLKFLLPSDIPDADIDEITRVYPSDVTQGSPYDTGTSNARTPQYKRIASVQGDMVFQGPRRFFVQSLNGRQNTWSFLSKRLKFIPNLGSFHGSDLLSVYGGYDMTDYLVRFATNLDPNGDTGIYWPKYTTAAPSLLTFKTGIQPLEITQDAYREEALKVATRVLMEHPM